MQEMEDGRRVEPGFEAHPDFDPADFEPRPFTLPERKRALVVVGILLALVLMAVLPPLINVNRFRRRIATSISESLGRPVHMDAVTLNVLPLPGFTLENFVVGEDPAFGAEPVIRANSVRATLRVRSLWRRRVEFSRISLTDPSVNLVHRADGGWNIESILLQAAKIEAAPTAQQAAGGAPRFPYIEATGARVNVKMGLEKMPVALTEAEFALWLPKPEQWRLRLEGHPSRTDTGATDTGTVRVQGTLGKAGTLKDVPVDLTAEWSAAPLGAMSKVLVGWDAGLRGDMTLRTSVVGTVGDNAVQSRLELRGVRRADFVPAEAIDADVACAGEAVGVFHGLKSLRCAWPADATAAGVVVTAELPELRKPGAVEGEAVVTDARAQGLVQALQVASPRVDAGLTLGGKISGAVSLSALRGSLKIADARLAVRDGQAFVDQDVEGELNGGSLTVAPVRVELGGVATLDGHLDRTGYGLHLSGTLLRSRLMEMAKALPQFGDGLEEAVPVVGDGKAVELPIKVDLVGNRNWSGGMVWAPVVKVASGRRESRKRVTPR